MCKHLYRKLKHINFFGVVQCVVTSNCDSQSAYQVQRTADTVCQSTGQQPAYTTAALRGVTPDRVLGGSTGVHRTVPAEAVGWELGAATASQSFFPNQLGKQSCESRS